MSVWVHRDAVNDIDAVFAIKQPGFAEEEMPDGTTITEKAPNRIARELRLLVKTFPDASKEAVKPLLDDLVEFVANGQKAKANNLVNRIGVLPTIDATSKTALLNKIAELV